jgi:DNA replication licensing factor MCM4
MSGGQSAEQLATYITHARNRVNPMITEEAGQALVKAYVELRKAGEDPRTSEKRITATTRQLESMIRLSEAHARMRYSDFVEAPDVAEAVRLMREALKTAAVDPLTGKIDLGLLNTGVSEGQRRLRADLRRALDSLLTNTGPEGVRWTDAMRRMSEQSSVRVETAEFAQAIKELEQEGVIKVVGERDRRTIRMLGMDRAPPADDM